MYDFDRPAARRDSDSLKWSNLPEDVIPMWVADMDFQSPPPIIDAMLERVQHGYYGYPYTLRALKETIIAHYEKTYHATVEADWIVWVPSVIPGVANALQILGGTYLYSTPMYDHIRQLYQETGRPRIEVPMQRDERCRYTMDMDALAAAVTPEVRSLVLCSPHNPVGRVFQKEELLALQDFCQKHGLVTVSDEIHCELDLENRHIPFFSLSDAAAQSSITLSSAGKICNIPGLPMGFAIIPNEELRQKFRKRLQESTPAPNVMTLAAYQKAYDGSCALWKEELRTYLRANRDLAEARLQAIPEIKTPHNEGTYLLWLDCSALGLEDPADFFLKHARIKVSPGEVFGCRQFVRLNLGCPRKQLTEVLDRIEAAVRERRDSMGS